MGERSIGILLKKEYSKSPKCHFIRCLVRGSNRSNLFCFFNATCCCRFFFFVTRRLPGYKRRIGGQCLPFEDFAIHKANKYFKQNGRLFLPGVVSNVEPRLI